MKALLKSEGETVLIWAEPGAFKTLYDFKKHLEEKFPDLEIAWLK